MEQVPTEPQQPEEVPEEAAPQETQAGQSQTETPDPLLTELRVPEKPGGPAGGQIPPSGR